MRSHSKYLRHAEIIRHVRFKGGFEADTIPNSGDNNGSASYTGVGDQLDIIVDHVSFGFGSTMPTILISPLDSLPNIQ